MQNSENLRTVSLEVNGHAWTRLVPASMTLLEFLRDELNLTGTKRGCDLGDCGCCTVLVNDKPMLSCLLPVLEVAGQKVRTIEGVARGAELHPVQQAFVDEGAVQCGFCTPAMVMNAVHLLENHPAPTKTQVKECVSGTICRCTGYTKIEKAIHTAAKICGEACEKRA